MNTVEIIILAPIFIIILLVTYKAVKSAFHFGTAGTFVMSVCVSALAVIGMSRFKGSLEVILLPYAALAVAILVLLLLSFISRYLAGTKESFRHRFDNRKSLEDRNYKER